MRRHSSLEIEVQQLLTQVKSAQTTLGVLKSEIRVTEDRRDKIRAEIATITERLKAEQTEELDTAKSLSEAKLEADDIQHGKLLAENQALVAQIDQLRSEHGSLTNDLTGRQSILTKLSQQIEAAKEKLDLIVAKATEAENTLAKAQTEAKQYEDVKQALEEEIAIFKQNRITVAGLVKAEENNLANISKTKLTEIANLDHRLLLIKQNSLKIQKELEVSRKEVADRTMALDQREAVLKRREFRISQDESTIRDNAGLLDL